jgi:Zn-dependent peptidase ImmA (M78 family)
VIPGVESALRSPHKYLFFKPLVGSSNLSADPQGWSAASYTVFGATTVIYNGKNSKGRQSSDIVHELAHVILDHEPSQVILSMDGEIAMHSFDAKQEDEANWFGWTLLLPRPALLHCAQMKVTVPQIAEEYKVSEQLVTFRAG